ncbi:hypothetical protein E8L99_22230 [Phreatobacter aquaticus]|uniref:Uncharacterized protein n=1 Tax=Phreatobacter aquaticus TaxID=2570229 RepID=A0A4D7QQL4_9HYPH|nr:hypothetical protein [Phreatobacter aquaticus]QCK88283.1 hypothetical protein E8L99_22230 [Phreatobacter aquaticus]
MSDLTKASQLLAAQKQALSAAEFLEIDRLFRINYKNSIPRFFESSPSSRPILVHLSVSIEVLRTRMPRDLSHMESIRFIPETNTILDAIKLYKIQLTRSRAKSSYIDNIPTIISALDESEIIIEKLHDNLTKIKTKNDSISSNIISLSKYIGDKQQIDAPLSVDFKDGKLIAIDSARANSLLDREVIEQLRNDIIHGIERYISYLNNSTNIDPRVTDMFVSLLETMQISSRERVIATGLQAQLINKALIASRHEIHDLVFINGSEIAGNTLKYCMQFSEWHSFQENSMKYVDVDRDDLVKIADSTISALDKNKNNVDPYITRTLTNIRSLISSSKGKIKDAAFAIIHSTYNIFVVLSKFVFEVFKKFGTAAIDGTAEGIKKTSAIAVAASLLGIITINITGITSSAEQLDWMKAIGKIIKELMVASK